MIRFFQQLNNNDCMLEPKKSYFIINIMLLIFVSWLTLSLINDDYTDLSNIISIRDDGTSANAKVVDVKSMIHYSGHSYTTYKYTIITNKKTNTITLNHRYQPGRTISIIEKSPSAIIEGTTTMSIWNLYQLNYQRDSASSGLFSLLLLCSYWVWGVIKLFTYNWWI